MNQAIKTLNAEKQQLNIKGKETERLFLFYKDELESIRIKKREIVEAITLLEQEALVKCEESAKCH